MVTMKGFKRKKHNSSNGYIKKVEGYVSVKITLILSLIRATRRLSGSRYLLLVKKKGKGK
jgi:hypothetical protein